MYFEPREISHYELSREEQHAMCSEVVGAAIVKQPGPSPRPRRLFRAEETRWCKLYNSVRRCLAMRSVPASMDPTFEAAVLNGVRPRCVVRSTELARSHCEAMV